MGTKVITAASLPQTVFVYEDGACRSISDHFCASHMVVIDGVEWPGMAAVRAGLIRERRGFKAPFHPPKLDTAVVAGYDSFVNAVDEFIDTLLTERREERSASFRPMITGPEPMHFDSYAAPVSILTCFVNVATTPRIYRVGPTFKSLVDEHPKLMRKIASQCEEHGMSYRIRDLTMAGEPPMPKDCDAHLVELAPGAIWFFNGKTVSHEVVHGEGAIAVSCLLPDSQAPTQQSLMRAIQ